MLRRFGKTWQNWKSRLSTEMAGPLGDSSRCWVIFHLFLQFYRKSESRAPCSKKQWKRKKCAARICPRKIPRCFKRTVLVKLGNDSHFRNIGKLPGIVSDLAKQQKVCRLGDKYVSNLAETICVRLCRKQMCPTLRKVCVRLGGKYAQKNQNKKCSWWGTGDFWALLRIVLDK